MLEFWQAIEQKVYNGLPQYNNMRDLFLFVTTEFYKAYASKPDLSRTLLRELSFVEGQLAERPWAKVDEMINLATMIVEQGKQAGEIRSDADANSVGLALFANYLFVLHIGSFRTRGQSRRHGQHAQGINRPAL